MRTTTRWALTLAVATTAVTACGGDDGEDDTEGGSDGTEATTTDSGTEAASGDDDAACEQTVAGSELTFASLTSPGQLDPTLIAGGVVGGTEVAALYDTLFTYDYENGEVVPHLAEGIEANGDFTEFTLTLREGIEFSDGTPLDVQVVADNLDRYLSDDVTAAVASFAPWIEEKEIVDETTLVLHMDRPWAEFPSFLAEQMGMIVNPNAIGDDVHAFAADPPDEAGVGPYVLERNAPGEEIVFTARDDYWGGPVCIETLRVVQAFGGPQAYDSFRAGDVDVVYLQDSGAVERAVDDGVSSEFVRVDVNLTMMLNHTDGRAASDPRLREAIWRAIDGEVMNERAYHGSMDISMSLIHPESVWGSDDLATVDHDPERARELVEEAVADGISPELQLLASNTPSANDAALAWQGMLEAVGFDVTLEVKPINDLVADVFAGEYDGAHYALNLEPAQLTARLYGVLHSGAANNRSHYQSEEMDAAVSEALAAPADERAEAVARINDLFVEDFVSPVFAATPTGIIWREGVAGVTVSPSSVYLFHDAYIEE